MSRFVIVLIKAYSKFMYLKKLNRSTTRTIQIFARLLAPCIAVSILILPAHVFGRNPSKQTISISHAKRGATHTDQKVFVLFCLRDVGKGEVLQRNDMDFSHVAKSKCPADSIDQFDFAEGRPVTIPIGKNKLIRLRNLGMNVIPNCPSRLFYAGPDNVPLPVIYSATRISEGHIFTFKDLLIKRIPVNKMPAHSFVSPYSLVGRKASMEIENGKFLFPWNVGIQSDHISKMSECAVPKLPPAYVIKSEHHESFSNAKR